VWISPCTAQSNRENARRRRGAIPFALRGRLIDILVDFPPEFEAEAWRRLEMVCAEERIGSDIKPLAWCNRASLERALRDAGITG
jgi:hypothetical protein